MAWSATRHSNQSPAREEGGMQKYTTLLPSYKGRQSMGLVSGAPTDRFILTSEFDKQSVPTELGNALAHSHPNLHGHGSWLLPPISFTSVIGPRSSSKSLLLVAASAPVRHQRCGRWSVVCLHCVAIQMVLQDACVCLYVYCDTIISLSQVMYDALMRPNYYFHVISLQD
jgi:hypothetical protein